MELSLILEGGISAAVKKNTMLGQMEIQYDTQGQFAGFCTQGSEAANCGNNRKAAEVYALGA